MTQPSSDKEPVLRDSLVERPYPRYIVEGSPKENPNNLVEISDGDYYFLVVGQESAEQIVKQQNALIDKLIGMANEFYRAAPKEFDDFWYSTYPRHYSWDASRRPDQ